VGLKVSLLSRCWITSKFFENLDWLCSTWCELWRIFRRFMSIVFVRSFICVSGGISNALSLSKDYTFAEECFRSRIVCILRIYFEPGWERYTLMISVKLEDLLSIERSSKDGLQFLYFILWLGPMRGSSSASWAAWFFFSLLWERRIRFFKKCFVFRGEMNSLEAEMGCFWDFLACGVIEIIGGETCLLPTSDWYNVEFFKNVPIPLF